MASGYAIAAGGTQVSTAENNKMKLGQKFAYEHGITFQSDQRTHILIYQTEKVFNYIGLCIEIPLRVTQHLKQVSTVEDNRVSAHLVSSSCMDVGLLTKLIKKNHTYHYT